MPGRIAGVTQPDKAGVVFQIADLVTHSILERLPCCSVIPGFGKATTSFPRRDHQITLTAVEQSVLIKSTFRNPADLDSTLKVS